MKLKQTIGIVLISIVLLCVNAIAVLADGNTNKDTTKYDSAMYDSTMYDSKTLKSSPELVAPNLIAAFTATRDPNNPLTVRFTENCKGKPVPYFWGTKYGLMTYFWGFGDKTTSILENPIHTFKEAGKYKVYLRIENAMGQVSKASMVINV